MNRGSARVSRGLGVLSGASMRPRFMNRGSGVAGFERLDGDLGFNEAPIHESGK